MRVLYIYRNDSMGYSIGRVFRPVELAMQQYAEVDSLYMPRHGYSLGALLQNIKCARKKVKSKSYDIIHITGQEHYLIPFLPKDKLIVTVHDLGFIRQEKGISGRIKHLLFVDSLSLAKIVTCISTKTLREVCNFCHMREGQIRVINNCVDPKIEYRPKSINKENPTILHIGTKSNKNLIRTIDALYGMKCRLRIVGLLDCEQKAKLASSGIEYSVVWNLSDQELHQEIYDCDIMSFPSLYEGFGMPIIEAQAAGRIVVTSDLSPMKEVAGTGAILVNPESVVSIAEGYSRALSEAKDWVEKGKTNANRFEVAVITQQYLSVYHELSSKKDCL